MSIYLNLAFVWGPESCGIFLKARMLYMINVLKINCGLIPVIIIPLCVNVVEYIAYFITTF